MVKITWVFIFTLSCSHFCCPRLAHKQSRNPDCSNKLQIQLKLWDLKPQYQLLEPFPTPKEKRCQFPVVTTGVSFKSRSPE